MKSFTESFLIIIIASLLPILLIKSGILDNLFQFIFLTTFVPGILLGLLVPRKKLKRAILIESLFSSLLISTYLAANIEPAKEVGASYFTGMFKTKFGFFGLFFLTLTPLTVTYSLMLNYLRKVNLRDLKKLK